MDSFYKEDTRKVNKQIKKMFNSYQEKATLLQNTGNSIAGNGVVEEELSWEWKTAMPVLESSVIPAKLNMSFLYDPTIMLSGIYSNELKTTSTHNNKRTQGWVWWCAPVISAPRRYQQVAPCEFRDRQSNVMKQVSLKKKKKNCTDVHSLLYNCQNMEFTQMTFRRWR